MKSEEEIKERIKRIKEEGSVHGFANVDVAKLETLKWVLENSEMEE